MSLHDGDKRTDIGTMIFGFLVSLALKAALDAAYSCTAFISISPINRSDVGLVAQAVVEKCREFLEKGVCKH
jgi:hypothetical protein